MPPLQKQKVMGEIGHEILAVDISSMSSFIPLGRQLEEIGQRTGQFPSHFFQSFESSLISPDTQRTSTKPRDNYFQSDGRDVLGFILLEWKLLKQRMTTSHQQVRIFATPVHRGLRIHFLRFFYVKVVSVLGAVTALLLSAKQSQDLLQS